MLVVGFSTLYQRLFLYLHELGRFRDVLLQLVVFRDFDMYFSGLLGSHFIDSFLTRLLAKRIRGVAPILGDLF